jgi:hypothetical protein
MISTHGLRGVCWSHLTMNHVQFRLTSLFSFWQAPCWIKSTIDKRGHHFLQFFHLSANAFAQIRQILSQVDHVTTHFRKGISHFTHIILYFLLTIDEFFTFLSYLC